MALYGPGDVLCLAAARQQDSHTPNLEVLVLDGRPICEPVAQYGPFVMNTEAELKQAVEDYRAGRLGVIPAEHLPHTTTGDTTGGEQEEPHGKYRRPGDQHQDCGPQAAGRHRGPQL